MTATGSHSSQRKNPESVSIVAQAIWQASQILNRMIISKSGHRAPMANALRVRRFKLTAIDLQTQCRHGRFRGA